MKVSPCKIPGDVQKIKKALVKELEQNFNICIPLKLLVGFLKIFERLSLM